MDSGNGSNQQQRYCPTPIMAPPVAASPPIMTGGNGMAPHHQPHHPPPSISPHPAAYYGHHSGGQSHYPTPSPTPPPMHHQQYYAHSYYAHGSHQQTQQPSQQSQHHGMTNAHVQMSSTPTAPPPVQQGQHSHLMGHGGYHHSQQPQTHHQQWAAPPHPHQQQQSHHYYHQPTHHPPPQQQQQQQQQMQPQQHGYPPPPHSPYPYVQPLPPAPTPPPHSPHPQQHIQPPPQQHPPVAASPGPVQMHQPSQQPPSHALMNLSRFVSQQSPSPCPSPRASPNIASHHQQVAQMGPQSPSPFGGHIDLDQHHTNMNGHTSSGGPSSPVMSPPPPMHCSQQAMSPPPAPPVPQQHHIPPPSPQTPHQHHPYNINGSSLVERSTSSSAAPPPPPDKGKQEGSADAHIITKERNMHNIFPNLSSGIAGSAKEAERQKKASANAKAQLKEQNNRVSSSTSSDDNTETSSSAPPSNNLASSVASTISCEDTTGLSLPFTEDIESGHKNIDSEVASNNGNGAIASESTANTGGNSRSSNSPQPKPMGSPTNAGNGHQMIPVRLQNMQKGARTKASMKKLMQEHQISTPNGQSTDPSFDSLAFSAKEVVDSLLEPALRKDMAEKSTKSPKKRKSQPVGGDSPPKNVTPAAPDTNDLTTPSEVAAPDVIRPGYTKSGKKIGRPRKESLPLGTTSVKSKGKKGTKATSKKSKSAKDKTVLEEPARVGGVTDVPLTPLPAAVPTPLHTSTPLIPEVTAAKGKGKGSKTTKASRKRSSKVLEDAGDNNEVPQNMSGDLSTSTQEVHFQIPDSGGESVTSLSGSKRRKKSKNSAVNVSPASSELVADTINVPSSEISEQEAESVVLRIVQPQIKTIIRGKGKRRKSITTVQEPKVLKAPKEKKTPASRKKSAIDEVEPIQERGELPRLRSRSPKQGESPPLRISSPRAAKERSTTPAASSNQTTSRSRSSREKEVPLASPTTRSPKKSPEKDKTKSRIGRAKAKSQESHESQNELLSPPVPALKRTRQMSKESSGSPETQKGRRKAALPERSPSPAKRSSRRKSGSVSGTPEKTLSSPSHSQSSLSVATSEISVDIPVELPYSGVVSTGSESVISLNDEQSVPANVPASTSTAKRRKTRKGSKSTRPKKQSKKSVASVVSEVLQEEVSALEEIHIPVTVPTPLSSPVTAGIEEIAVAKPKKARKAATKKGKKANVSKEVAKGESSVTDLLPGQVDSADSVSMDPTPPPKKQKGKTTKKALKQVLTSTQSPAVLNIPTPPAAGSHKKRPSTSRVSKVKKQRARSGKKPLKQIVEPPQVINTAEDLKPAPPDENDSKSEQYVQPLRLSPPRLRRPSVVSPNTQSSAKSSTSSGTTEAPLKSDVTTGQIGSPAKIQRRDSRSISRDYDVSVVLTDIAQSLTSGELSGLSSGLSLQSPFSPDQDPMSPPAEPLSKVTPESTLPMGDSNSYEAPSLPNTDAGSETPKPGKKKRQSKQKSTTDDSAQPTKKKLKLQYKMELQERKANLEAEVAQVLLELKTGTNSKSPSPAKVILSPELKDEPTKRSKPGKQRKRKMSASPRRSVDTTVTVETALDESAANKQPPVNTPVIPLIPPVSDKGGKRKGIKERRRSSAKGKSKGMPSVLKSSLKVVQSTGALDDTSGVAGTAAGSETLVEVANTAPTTTTVANVLGIEDQIVSPVAGIGKASKGTKRKGKASSNTVSPDITSFSSSADGSIVIAEAPKRKRNRAVKVEAKQSLTNSNSEAGSLQIATLPLDTPHVGGVPPLPSPDIPAKKKRQRKRNVPAVAVTLHGNSEAVPSTSSGISGDKSNLDPKFFPYQTDRIPIKKPTVFVKHTSFAQVKSGKEDDNQKKKGNDAPVLRVMGGLAKFFRGGEEEEVDPDPRLPKEKAPAQTDNSVPWICSFCHLGPHAQKLGDLFGPYFANLPSIYGKPSPKRETWMHGDCALWAGRLLLIGTYLRKLEETLLDADKATCTVCEKTGATIGCLRRGCREAVHFPCAIRKFWKIDEQEFHSYCPRHIPLNR